jgi:hypothetical protein
MPDNVELMVRLHPVGGDDVTILTRDFAGEREALDAVIRALDERRSLLLTNARYNRERQVTGVVVNLTNIVSVRVSTNDSPEAGQYL